ncbi:MAG: serine/threonine protein kinase psk1 [Watsoniomyces obsoletus]|nr:MAG: serine/threonine protein kinase psk1 [Watsoniomyces obsoletus]
MPAQYRIEISPNNRAGCKNKECKDANIKIMKGELRFGTLVEINQHQSWTYKHWGCITPRVIANLKEVIEDNVDLFDGYDELPEPEQEKMRRALEQGHVDDDDWKGDLELNRPGMNGFRKRTPKKKAANPDEEMPDATQDGTEPESPTKKPAPKKRGRAVKAKAEPKTEEDNGIKNEVDHSEAEPAPKKRGRAAKKPKMEEEDDEEDEKVFDFKSTPDEEDVKPAVAIKNEKKTRGRPKKVEAESDVAEKKTRPARARKVVKAESPDHDEDEDEYDDADDDDDGDGDFKGKKPKKTSGRAPTKLRRQIIGRAAKKGIKSEEMVAESDDEEGGGDDDNEGEKNEASVKGEVVEEGNAEEKHSGDAKVLDTEMGGIGAGDDEGGENGHGAGEAEAAGEGERHDQEMDEEEIEAPKPKAKRGRPAKKDKVNGGEEKSTGAKTKRTRRTKKQMAMEE